MLLVTFPLILTAINASGVLGSSPSDCELLQHEALSATMLQNLFPSLNVATARLAAFRRVVLVHQLPESEGGGASTSTVRLPLF